MFFNRTHTARAAMLATLGGATLMLSAATRDVAPSMFGGPWISIEAPANPYDQATRGSLMLVHTFHHGYKVEMPLVGRAEGLVDGQRKSVALTLTKGSQAGTHGVRNQWGDKGTWTVMLTATQPEPQASIQAVVDINADGSVGKVTVPEAGGRLRLLSAAEIDRGLRARAGVPTVVGGR
jgi:hypothetical protein